MTVKKKKRDAPAKRRPAAKAAGVCPPEKEHFVRTLRDNRQVGPAEPLAPGQTHVEEGEPGQSRIRRKRFSAV